MSIPASINYRFFKAIRDKNTKKVEEMLAGPVMDTNGTAHIIDPNMQESGTSVTPLMIAVYTKQNDMAELLLRHKANPDIMDDMGMAPLHHALAHGNDKMVEILVQSGADVNSRTLPSGNTPIQFAVSYNRHDAFSTLARNGAKLDILTHNGHSLLHLAAASGNRLAASFLALKMKADVNARDHSGKKARDLALNKDMHDLLLKWENEKRELERQVHQSRLDKLDLKCARRRGMPAP